MGGWGCERLVRSIRGRVRQLWRVAVVVAGGSYGGGDELHDQPLPYGCGRVHPCTLTTTPSYSFRVKTGLCASASLALASLGAPTFPPPMVYRLPHP